MNLVRLCCGPRPDAVEQPVPVQAPRATPLGNNLRELGWLANKCALLLSHEGVQVGMAALFQFAQLWTKPVPEQPLPLNSPEYLACKQILNGTSLIAPNSATKPIGAVFGALAPAPGAIPAFIGSGQSRDFCKKQVAAQEAAFTIARLDCVIDQRGIDRSYGLAFSSLRVTITALAGAVIVPYALNKLACLVDRCTHDANEWTAKTYRRAAKYFGAFGVVGMALGFAGALGAQAEVGRVKVENFDPLALKPWNSSDYETQRVEQNDWQRRAELAGWFVLSSAVFGAAAVPFAMDRWGRHLVARAAANAARPQV